MIFVTKEKHKESTEFEDRPLAGGESVILDFCRRGSQKRDQVGKLRAVVMHFILSKFENDRDNRLSPTCT